MANTVLTANTNVLIPFQFPAFYQEDYGNFVSFVQAYYQWLEQSNNALYYARRIYDIGDVDNTFDQFIIYFKEKYLKNIQFNTVANIRMVIKHALDIYRSKGTERGATLLFQLTFDETPTFYYPSTDLFKLSDGNWRILKYLELSLSDNNINLLNKEVQGAFSGATAFVDEVIRRQTNGRFEDVAYISAISGSFSVGEQVVPTDGSLNVNFCPSILGSLNDIEFVTSGSGQNYVVGTDIPLSSINGEDAILLVGNNINQAGAVTANFVDGGYGYSVNTPTASIGYSGASGTINNNVDIWSYYANGSVAGQGYVTANGVTSLTVTPLSGNLQVGNTIYTYANVISAAVGSYTTTVAGPNIITSNVVINIANIAMTTSNLEYGSFFGYGDLITEPLATLNYVLANGTLLTGMNVFTWSGGSQTGNGVIIEVNAANSTAGVIVVSVYAGTMNPGVTNAIFTQANAIGANLSTSNGYNNSTATGNFLANSNLLTLTTTASNGTFMIGEIVFQYITNPGPFPDFKVGGWGTIELVINNSTIVVQNTYGRFTSFGGTLDSVVGAVSGATANVLSSSLSVGLINPTNQFIASPYAYIYGTRANGICSNAVVLPTSLTITVANTVSDPQSIQVNIDTMNTYSSVLMNAASYGFPANPLAGSNATAAGVNAIMSSCMNMQNLTVGELTNIVVSGLGIGYGSIPYVVVENPLVSQYYIYRDILWIQGATGAFTANDIVTQAATGAQGQWLQTNTTAVHGDTFLYLKRMNFSNDFITTVNTATQIVGSSSNATANVISVDYDIINPLIMGRDAVLNTVITTGNAAITNGTIVTSGFGFVNGEQITVGSNNAVGTAILEGIGFAAGYYDTKGGFLSDQKKLFDGYYWQNFSYQINSGIMLNKYNQMMQDLCHVAGTILFGNFVHNSADGSSLGANMVYFNSNTYALMDETDTITLTDETGTKILTSW